MPEAAGIYFSDHEGGQENLPPVVLIHGAGGSYLNWPVGLRRMAGARVLAVDLPGHGRSKGFAQQSITTYADLLHDFLEQIGLREVVLVGHSMGGAVALTMALKYPRSTACLGLLATGASLKVDPALIEALSNPVTYLSGLHLLQQQAFSPSTPPALVDACMRQLHEIRPSLLLADWLACASYDLRSLIDQINIPAWIACGVDDRITPQPYAHFLAAHLPGAVLEVFSQAGHMLMQEQPARVTDGLSRFLTLQLPAIEDYRWKLQRSSVRVDKSEKRGPNG